MIQLFRPTMNTEVVLQALRPVLESGWIGMGPKVEEFEEKTAPWTGQRYFVATSSCTAALHLALRWLGLRSGKWIYTTPITFISTNAILLYEGLRPLFGAVDERTGLLREHGHCTYVESCETQIVVHLGGFPCQISPKNPYGISINTIEDCAHAFGSTLPPTDNLRCWSFNEKKNLPIGLGGGISTNDAYTAQRLRRMRWMGIDRSTHERTSSSGYEPQYDIPELGFKYEMNDIQAAIGLAMLPLVDKHNEIRRHIAQRYLTEVHHLGTSITVDDISKSSCHFLPLHFENRDEVAKRLKAVGIQTGIHYRRNDLYPVFQGRCERVGQLGDAQWYQDHELTLPIHPMLSEEDVDKVIGETNRAVEGNQAKYRVGAKKI